MTSTVFEEWIRKFDSSMRLKGRQVLLLLDNATSHKVPDGLKNTKVKFFKPKLTAHLQPMDAGIIRNFKLYYRKGLVRHFIEAAEADKPLDINLKEALSLTKQAWSLVKPETVSNCWLHTGILNSQTSFSSSTEQHSSTDELVEEMEALYLPGSDVMTAENGCL